MSEVILYFSGAIFFSLIFLALFVVARFRFVSPKKSRRFGDYRQLEGLTNHFYIKSACERDLLWLERFYIELKMHADDFPLAHKTSLNIYLKDVYSDLSTWMEVVKVGGENNADDKDIRRFMSYDIS